MLLNTKYKYKRHSHDLPQRASKTDDERLDKLVGKGLLQTT